LVKAKRVPSGEKLSAANVRLRGQRDANGASVGDPFERQGDRRGRVVDPVRRRIDAQARDAQHRPARSATGGQRSGVTSPITSRRGETITFGSAGALSAASIAGGGRAIPRRIGKRRRRNRERGRRNGRDGKRGRRNGRDNENDEQRAAHIHGTPRSPPTLMSP